MRNAPDPAPQLPSTFFLIKYVELVIGQHLEGLLRPLGLTIVRFLALSDVQRESGLTSADLARRAHVSPQAMIGTVSDLEAAGLISRAVDPDHARRLVIRLTPSGQERLDQCQRELLQFESQATADLSPTERTALRAYLGTIRDTLDGLEATPGRDVFAP